MGSSAPSAPQFKLPAGTPAFQPSDSGISDRTLYNSAAPNSSAIWNAGGNPTWSSAQGQSLGAAIQGYNATDTDFAKRFPGMLNAQNLYQGDIQNIVGTQTPASINQGNALMNAGAATMPMARQAMQTGQGYANQAQGFFNNAATLGQQASTAGNQDMALGQKLVNGQQPLDPLVQQELMRSGLSSAAGSLGGAAGLGGTAGQAAVGTQLGVGAQNWINQQRTMGQQLQQTGVGMDTGLAGAAGTLSSAGAGEAGAGAGLMNAGSGIMNAGTGAMTGGQGIINNAVSNANQTMAVGSSLFQPRDFGIGPTDAANIALSNTAGQNNFNQFIYGTKVGVAAQNAGIGASNANASAAANNANSQAAIGGGTAAATTAATVAAMAAGAGCWVAKCIYGEMDIRFHQFRFWLMNLAPKSFKQLYLEHGRDFAAFLDRNPTYKYPVQLVMDAILLGAPNVYA